QGLETSATAGVATHPPTWAVRVTAGRGDVRLVVVPLLQAVGSWRACRSRLPVASPDVKRIARRKGATRPPPSRSGASALAPSLLPSPLLAAVLSFHPPSARSPLDNWVCSFLALLRQ